jgi:hypothetical protein
MLDIQFCISLTLLVTATGRAFPSAHLSPHVSTYKWIAGEVTFWPWFWHMLGGLVASFLVLFWNTRRLELHESQQVALKKSGGGSAVVESAVYYNVPGAEPIGDPGYWKGPEKVQGPREMMHPGRSLSISFAKAGGYF